FENSEAPGVPIQDVQDVSNYVAALNHGMRRLREGFPLSLRLIREIHGVLLSEGRGSNKEPGEFRRSQNWIGGTRPGNAEFVPPRSMRTNQVTEQNRMLTHGGSGTLDLNDMSIVHTNGTHRPAFHP